MNPTRRRQEDLIFLLERLNAHLVKDNSPQFLHNYKEWEMKRRETIEILQKLHQEMTKVNSNTNLARDVGKDVTILGSLASLAGFVLSFKKSTQEIGQNLMKYGAAAGAVGGGTMLAASGANCYISKQLMDKAKRILLRDENMTKQLLPFFRSVEEKKDMIEDIFGCNLISDTMDDVYEAIDLIIIIFKEGEKTYFQVKSLIKGNIDEALKQVISGNFNLRMLEKMLSKFGSKVKLLLEYSCENPNVLKALMKFRVLVKKTSVIVDSLNLFSELLQSEMFLNLLNAVGIAIPKTLSSVILLSSRVMLHMISQIEENEFKNESNYSVRVENVKSILEKELCYLSDLYNIIN